MIAMIHTNSVHKGMYETLVLLELAGVYFVVEGVTKYGPRDKVQDHEEYFYNEHTCPTNFIRIPLIAKDGDCDPHGVFTFVESVWMTTEYKDAEQAGPTALSEYLCKVFPQLRPK